MSTNRQRFMWLLAIAMGAGLAILILYRRSNMERTGHTSPPDVTPSIAAMPETIAPAVEQPQASPPVVVLEFASELERELIRTDNPEASLQAIDQILFFYRRIFRENPVGQNEDITAALLGANPRRVAFLPADSTAIRNGQLVDPWGTPYWFHPLSGQQMEIRSAGPDREIFTPDDIHGRETNIGVR